MQKFGEFICKHKKIILIIALILLIPSVIGMKATKINYDIGIDDRVSNDIIKNIRDSEYI